MKRAIRHDYKLVSKFNVVDFNNALQGFINDGWAPSKPTDVDQQINIQFIENGETLYSLLLIRLAGMI